jgi:hypothetical protein
MHLDSIVSHLTTVGEGTVIVLTGKYGMTSMYSLMKQAHLPAKIYLAITIRSSQPADSSKK